MIKKKNRGKSLWFFLSFRSFSIHSTGFRKRASLALAIKVGPIYSVAHYPLQAQMTLQAQTAQTQTNHGLT
ncbi:hypothetical protein V6Z11_D05G391000 [Gossypium hirsutum]